jgi:uncharacterized membrane protein
MVLLETIPYMNANKWGLPSQTKIMQVLQNSSQLKPKEVQHAKLTWKHRTFLDMCKKSYVSKFHQINIWT